MNPPQTSPRRYLAICFLAKDGWAQGNSAVRNTERDPASFKRLTSSVSAIRELLTDGETEWEGGMSKMNWKPDSDPPIYIAASGPKTLISAGKVADGVAFYGNRDRISWARERVAKGARETGRDPEDVTLWVATAGEVVSSKADAIDSLRHTLADSLHFQGKHGTLEEFSDDVAERIRQLSSDYRPDCIIRSYVFSPS